MSNYMHWGADGRRYQLRYDPTAGTVLVPVVLEAAPAPFRRQAAYLYITEADELPRTEEARRQDNPVARVKLFGGPATYWIAGYDPDTRLAYGVAEIHERESGDFSMEELVALRIPPFSLPLERDLYFTPAPLFGDGSIMQGGTP